MENEDILQRFTVFDVLHLLSRVSKLDGAYVIKVTELHNFTVTDAKTGQVYVFFLEGSQWPSGVSFSVRIHYYTELVASVTEKEQAIRERERELKLIAKAESKLTIEELLALRKCYRAE